MKRLRAWAPQVVRRGLQLAVVAFIVYAALGTAWRNHKVAHNHRRLVGLMHGDTWAALYGLNEDALSLIGEPYEVSLGFLGMPWGSRVFGVDGADPIMVAAHTVRTGQVEGGLLLDLLLPLFVVLVAGKFFCSHLCPMRLVFELGQMVRAGLIRLRVPLPEIRHRARFGGWVLLGGLLATLAASTAVWFYILPYAALSVGLFLYVTAGVVANVIAVVLFWAVLDALVAPGYFCHNLCPTGFLLEQAGRLSLWRLRKKGAEPCPAGCNLCTRACPYALSPKDRTHTPACDNCGKCAVACPTDRLARKFALPVIAGVALMVLAPSTAEAHHNKGLPHYGYFENYPQVPTEEYITIQGRWEMGATIFNFQGMERENSDTPNDVKIYTYLYDLEGDHAFRGPVDFEIRRAGEVVSRFARDAPDEEAVYSTRETMPGTGNYTLVAVLADGAEVELAFYVDLDEGGINGLLIGAIGLPVAILFALALYGRGKKRRRSSRSRGRVKVIATGVLLALMSVPSLVHAAPGEVCPHCGMIDCTMEHVATSDGGSIMVMGGIPLWLFLVGVAGIIIVSFVATEWLAPRAGKGFRWDLTRKRKGWVNRYLRSRWAQAVPQLFMMVMLVGLIYIGLAGSRVANLTPIAVWTIWWGALIVAVLFAGSVWCFVCPWDGFANLVTRLGLRKRVEPLTLGLRYPGWLANVYPAVLLFALLTWLELGYGVTTDPRATAYMGITMIGLAVGVALLFDGKRFCAHMCPVGRICGIYSTFSPVEIRGRKERTCQSCQTQDCLTGNDKGYPCPTGLSLKTITSSSMCTMCTECVKSCDKQNVALRIRPFGADLRAIQTPRFDEAWLALALLALTLFHGFSMTPVWEDYRPGETSILRWMAVTFGTGKTVNFTIAMVAVCAVPVALYALACKLGARWGGVRGIGGATLFRVYAYSLLPVALFYHLAHNVMHLVMEGGHVVPLLSDPMGDGSNYLGTRGLHLGHLLPELTLWHLQVGLILIGHIAGIIVAHRAARAVYPDRRAATRSLVPMLLMMVVISIGGLALMHLDMNMRAGRM